MLAGVDLNNDKRINKDELFILMRKLNPWLLLAAFMPPILRLALANSSYLPATPSLLQSSYFAYQFIP